MSDDFISHTVKILGAKYNKKGDKDKFLIEFEDILENKKNDFPWTAKEMNKLWPLLDKYKRTDAFQELAEMILFEKILHFLVPERKYSGDMAAWRDVFTHQDPILKRQVLVDLEEKRGLGYLKTCETRAHIFLNSFYFNQLEDIYIEVRSVFAKAYSNVALKVLPTMINLERIIKEVA